MYIVLCTEYVRDVCKVEEYVPFSPPNCHLLFAALSLIDASLNFDHCPHLYHSNEYERVRFHNNTLTVYQLQITQEVTLYTTATVPTLPIMSRIIIVTNVVVTVILSVPTVILANQAYEVTYIIHIAYE